MMEVLVEYDYTAEEPDELTIKKNEIIKDVSQFEEGWFIGNLNGKIGVFPDNFVKILESEPKHAKSPITPIVETVKEPRSETNHISPNECADDQERMDSLKKPQRVTGIGLGNIFSGQPIQLKQTSLKDVMKEAEPNSEKTLNSGKSDTTHSPVLADRVRARFEYQPKQLDELEMQVDDVIQVLDRSVPDEGWWKGKNLRTRKIGVFPDNFVVGVTEINEDREDDYSRQTVKGVNLSNGGSSATNISPRVTAGNISMQSNALISPTSTQGTYDAPKVAAKPISMSVTQPGGMVNAKSPAFSIAHRDYPKVSVANAPGRVGSTSNVLCAGQVGGDQTAGLPNASRTNKWRANTDTLDRPKSRVDESHTITSGDSKDSVDTASQQLNALTADRPKQTGRRLPSKFTRPSTPTSEHSSEAHLNTESVTRVNTSQKQRSGTTSHDELLSTMDTSENSRSVTGPRATDLTSKSHRVPIAGQAKNGRLSYSQAYRSVSPVSHAASQRLSVSGTTNIQVTDTEKKVLNRNERRWTNSHAGENSRISIKGPLQRSEGMSGSVDLVRPSESAGTKCLAPDTPRATQTQHAHHHFVSKPQTQSFDQLQSQHTQYVNEARQQFRDMQRQINQLNDANAQLRMDMTHGHRVFTERLQTLMNEIDEVKKQRAADVVEITRLRSLLMQLDAKAILTSSESVSVRNQIQTSTAKTRPHSGDRVDEPTAQLPDDAQSIYDEDEDSADQFKRMIGDNHNGTFLNKNADFALNNIHGKVGISRAAPTLQPRPSQPSSNAKT
ncbi:hypothetical protein EG68_06561 [Paragonimus skrjabini miyazakii]|uniref:SH3 domain-containing protein n=1 Tax=Paragonimus skrjabini miyazakii TaxID=59628 RepID=A0A8S9Y9V3_9TREM|nr:hypothetical protein EG68_06561 [Paragonimus skrjabini miyazakii]